MLTAEQLYNAYANGIFPMAANRDDTELRWYDPPLRGILPIDDFHLSARLRKTVRTSNFTVTINQNFPDVMRACAAREETWINDKIIALYTELHQHGVAHSIEVWNGDQMVGGLYGVSIGGTFCGESMFSTARDASKIALVHLIARLKARGYILCDTQFTTPHLAQFGGHEIPRAAYHAKLAESLNLECQFLDAADGSAGGNAALVSVFVSG